MTSTKPTSIYDDDFFAWTQEQAAALRLLPRKSAGQLDLSRVAEEIEDLGKRDLREVESLLKKLIEHLIKIDTLPATRDTRHWISEAIHFQDAAVAAYSPSMRQSIDVIRLWERGQRLAVATLEEHGRTWVSIPCPFDLDALLTADFVIADASERLSDARAKLDQSPP